MKNSLIGKVLTLLVVIFVLTGLVPLAGFAQEEGEITGFFSNSPPPTMNNVEIFEAGTDTVPETLTPQQEYDIKVTVGNQDGIGRLESLVVKPFMNTTSSGAKDQHTEEVFDAASQFVITWDAGGDVTHNRPGTSWALNDYTVPDESNDEELEFTFVFTIKISRIANETYRFTGHPTGWLYVWYFGAKVKNDAGLTAYGHFDHGQRTHFDMNWYGEIAVPSEHTVDWGSLPQGTNFADDGAEQPLGASLIHYCNSNIGHEKTVKAETSWKTEDEEHSVTLVEDLSGTTDSFALKAQLVGNFELAHLFLADGEPVVLATTSMITNEAGSGFSNSALWLALSPTMTCGRIYSGSITYGIRNIP